MNSQKKNNQTRKTTTVKVWESIEENYVVVCEPGNIDVVFNELSALPVKATFDLRITLARVTTPTWEGTKCGSYGRMYLIHDAERKVPAQLFRLKLMRIAYKFLGEETTCARGLIQDDKAFLELWFKTGNHREAKFLSGKFADAVKEEFKDNINQKTHPKTSCIEHQEGKESTIVRREQPQTSKSNSDSIVRSKTDETVQKLQNLFCKTRTIDNNEVKVLLKTLSPDPSAWTKGHEKIRKFVLEENGEYNPEARDALLSACVNDLVRYQNKSPLQNNGYSMFARLYLPALQSLARVELKPTILPMVLQWVLLACGEQITTCKQNPLADFDEREGDYICNAIGMLLALRQDGVIPQSETQAFDVLLQEMPSKVAARIGFWLNVCKDVEYPCSSKTPLIDKINASKSTGERLKMSFFLDRLVIPGIVAIPTGVHQNEQTPPIEEVCGICGDVKCIGECQPYECSFCGGQSCDGECDVRP